MRTKQILSTDTMILIYCIYWHLLLLITARFRYTMNTALKLKWKVKEIICRQYFKIFIMMREINLVIWEISHICEACTANNKISLFYTFKDKSLTSLTWSMICLFLIFVVMIFKVPQNYYDANANDIVSNFILLLGGMHSNAYYDIWFHLAQIHL